MDSDRTITSTNSSLLNPYKLFHISYDCTWEDLQTIYYQMVLLYHPEKNKGPQGYMLIIHKCYCYIKQQINNKKKNVTEQQIKKEFREFLKKPIPLPSFSKICENLFKSKNVFKKYYTFELLSEEGIFHKGYGELMLPSAYANKEHISTYTDCFMGNETVELFKNKKNTNVNLNDHLFYINCKNTSDFSITFHNELKGIDYVKAFSHRKKITSYRKEYKNIEELMDERNKIYTEQQI